MPTHCRGAPQPPFRPGRLLRPPSTDSTVSVGSLGENHTSACGQSPLCLPGSRETQSASQPRTNQPVRRGCCLPTGSPHKFNVKKMDALALIALPVIILRIRVLCYSTPNVHLMSDVHIQKGIQGPLQRVYTITQHLLWQSVHSKEDGEAIWDRAYGQ